MIRKCGFRKLATVLFMLALTAPQAWAWGYIGHYVCAKKAEERLTPKAKAAVSGLLGSGVALTDVASWADEQKEVPRTAPWHSVNVPIGESRYDSRYCAARGCIVSKIEEFKQVLKSAAGKREKAQALKFLIHLIADLHQPLHVGDNNDRGGNLLQVRFFGEGSNLHRVWDYQMIEHYAKYTQVWLWDVSYVAARPKMADQWSKGTTEEWATESLILAKAIRKTSQAQATIKPGARLDADYLRASIPVIQRQLAKAGVRTAWVLNQIFH